MFNDVWTVYKFLKKLLKSKICKFILISTVIEFLLNRFICLNLFFDFKQSSFISNDVLIMFGLFINF